jgi:hypothetical protein
MRAMTPEHFQYPIPSHMRVEVSSSPHHEEIPLFNFQFDENFPGPEYPAAPDARDEAFERFYDQVAEYLTREYQLGELVKNDPMLVTEYTHHLLAQYGLIHFSLKMLREFQEEGNIEGVLNLSLADNPFSIQYSLDKMSFEQFLRYDISHRAVQYHPLYTALPENYLLTDQINITFEVEGEIVTGEEIAEVTRGYKEQIKKRMLEKHQRDLEHLFFRALRKMSQAELLELLQLGGEDIYQVVNEKIISQESSDGDEVDDEFYD